MWPMVVCYKTAILYVNPPLFPSRGFFKSKFGKEGALTQTEEEQTGVLFLHFETEKLISFIAV